MAKQFQSNTIVPNKSTMVEEDDDPDTPLSLENGEAGNYGRMGGGLALERERKQSADASEVSTQLFRHFFLTDGV